MVKSPLVAAGSDDACVPLLSDSHSGITLKAGMPGGMEEAGEVSRDLLKINEFFFQ